MYPLNKQVFFVYMMLSVSILACGADDSISGQVTELPKLSIENVNILEGDEGLTSMNFKVLMNTPSDKAVTVNFQTEEISASETEDNIPIQDVLTIAAGLTEAEISIEILTDTLKENDEQFRVKLFNPSNASLLYAEGVGSIRNDDTYVYVPDDGYITPENYPGYTLVWQDEFNGSTINSSDWTHELGASGWGNNEWQNYTARPENSFLSDGKLIIEAREESYQGADYTSARMITQGKESFQFGRVDIRAKLPEGQGIWPALWMLGNEISNVGWPACGEIDIMELVGHEPSTVHGTAHWGPQGQGFSNYQGNGTSLSGGEKFSEKFHVFSIIWEPNSIKWFVDDEQYFSLDNGQVNGAYPFNGEFFFIFNVAVGGNWPGYPDATTVFPQRMYVDYIRVFQ